MRWLPGVHSIFFRAELIHTDRGVADKSHPDMVTILRGSAGPLTRWLPAGWDRATRSRTYIQDGVVEEQRQGGYEVVVALLLHL